MIIAIHSFAGGFTSGVQRVFPVNYQLETHGFGIETAESLGVPVINRPFTEWPLYPARFVFGNPRCNAFSCTSSLGQHGQWMPSTRDIHELCDYGIRAKADIIIWESVQQAYTHGEELRKHLIDLLQGYRIVHIFMNTATWGNAQIRRRYFFVAYKQGRNFNIVPPELKQAGTVKDAIWNMRHITVREFDGEWTVDTYRRISKLEHQVMPYLHVMNDINDECYMHEERIKEHCPDIYQKWITRRSHIPFSIHCIIKLGWDRESPSLCNSCSRLIHPEFHRLVTPRECAAIMGWKHLPIGNDMFAQIAKGIVPDVGEWLAQQVQLYFEDHWGNEDFESMFDMSQKTWVGRYFTNEPREKIFDMTRYVCFKQ